MMTNTNDWVLKTYKNEWTGEERQTWRKSTHTASGHKVLYEVYELGGRFYWSANILIKNRPDLSRIAYGTYAATPYSLSAAKSRATRLGKAALNAAKTPRHLTRAA
jgi:hypothetical protein